MDVDPAVNRRPIMYYHIKGWHVPGALQAGTDEVRCAHPRRDADLSQTGRQPRVDHFANEDEDGAEAVMLGLDSGGSAIFAGAS